MTLPPKLSIRDILDPEADYPLCRFLRALLLALLICIGILVAGVLACPIAGCQATFDGKGGTSTVTHKHESPTTESVTITNEGGPPPSVEYINALRLRCGLEPVKPAKHTYAGGDE